MNWHNNEIDHEKNAVEREQDEAYRWAWCAAFIIVFIVGVALMLGGSP